jgi:glycerophosphoryl diester phosphodiesterase
MKVLTWTVNDAAEIRRLIEAGVDGMIGDDPVGLAAGR